MTIFVVGGSNSLRKDGWVSVFQRDHAGLVNLSVGATTSITGLFRMMTTPEIRSGDVVIWEYALNEANHIRRGHTPQSLLAHVEHLLLYARARGMRVAPAVFTPRWLEKRQNRAPYFDRLHALLNHYGLKPFDMSAEYRAALGKKVLPKATFKDGAHYAQSEEVLGFISRGVSRAVGEASVPAQVEPRNVRGQNLELITSFTDDVFENSIMRVPVAQLPLRVILAKRAEVAAVTFFSSPQKDAFEMIVPGNSGDRVLPISATHKTKQAPALLKTAVVPPDQARSMKVAPRGTVRFENWSGSGQLVVAFGCKKKLTAPSAKPLARIAGVFVFTRPWWARLDDLARSAYRSVRRRFRKARASIAR